VFFFSELALCCRFFILKDVTTIAAQTRKVLQSEVILHSLYEPRRVPIAIDGSSLVARREHETARSIVQKEAIVYYSHVGRFLAVAADRIDVSIAYVVSHTLAHLVFYY